MTRSSTSWRVVNEEILRDFDKSRDNQAASGENEPDINYKTWRNPTLAQTNIR